MDKKKMETRPRPYIRLSVHNWPIWGPRLSVVCVNPLTHIQSWEGKSIFPCQSGTVIPRQTSTVKYIKIWKIVELCSFITWGLMVWAGARAVWYRSSSKLGCLYLCGFSDGMIPRPRILINVSRRLFSNCVPRTLGLRGWQWFRKRISFLIKLVDIILIILAFIPAPITLHNRSWVHF